MPILRHAPLLPALFLACLTGIIPYHLRAAGAQPPAALPEAAILNTTTHRLQVVEPPEIPGLPPVIGAITATVRLIAAPVLPDPPPTTPAAAHAIDLTEPPASPDQEATLVFLSATVYDHSRTFLRWSPPGQPGCEFTAWSNLDFNHFSGPSAYPLVLGLGNEMTAPPSMPALPDLAAGGPAFTLVQGDPSDLAALRIIQDLHFLYRTRGAAMAAAFTTREAALQKRRAFLLTHPPTPQNVEIFFWKTGPAVPASQPPAIARGPFQPFAGAEPGREQQQQQLFISPGGPDTWSLTWQGVAGRTYFIQWSLDLATWTYAPFMDHGDGPKSYAVRSTAPKMFFRLVSTDQITTDPDHDDFDGDHVSNRDEVLQGTDPFGNADDDLDGLPSDWEVRFLLNPHDPLDAAADRDGDGISNLAEFTSGTDPTDYYNGEKPSFTLISGDQQYAEPDTFSAAPLVAELRVNGIPQPNAPVRIEAFPSTPALISLSSDGSQLGSRIDATSGPDGRVAVFVKHGSAAASNYFNFSAGSEVISRFNTTASATTQVRSIYPPGTLGRDATDAIDDRLAGKDPLAAKPVFSLQDHAAAAYIRNPGCWAYDLRQQMACISPWNSMDGALRAGVAITPRHVLNAAHFFLNPGTVIRFITAGNAVVERTIVSRVIHPGYQPDPPYPDLAVYTLDSDLPPEITPCKMLPSGFPTVLGPLGPCYPPALGLDQEEKALVFDFGKISPPGSPRSFATFYPPTLPAVRSSYYESVITGDSGNPAFLILHDSLTLLTVWSTGALGTFVTAHLADLDTMITAADTQAGVSTGYQVQTVDLDGYLPFSP